MVTMVRPLHEVETIWRTVSPCSFRVLTFAPCRRCALTSCVSTLWYMRAVFPSSSCASMTAPSFKFTKLFLGETRYIGEVARSDLSQSVARTVMDVQKLALEINHSQYSNPPVAGFDVNPALVVSLINITPILPRSLTRHVFFHELSTSFISVIGLHNPSGHIKSPSSFKYELGKDFQNYFEHIPGGYQRLLPESIGQATELASELKDYSDNSEYDRHLIRSTRFETSADSAVVVYDFAYDTSGQRRTYLVKITLWPLVCVETQNVLITGQYVAPTRSV